MVVGPVGVDGPVVVNVAEAAIIPSQDPTLLKVLGRGFYWQHLAVADAAEIAEREGLHRVTVNDVSRFALLAPGIVQAALDGSLPQMMSLEVLQRHAIPLDWKKQRGSIDELARRGCA